MEEKGEEEDFFKKRIAFFVIIIIHSVENNLLKCQLCHEGLTRYWSITSTYKHNLTFSCKGWSYIKELSVKKFQLKEKK